MSWEDTLPIAIPACVALLGFAATYRNSMRLAKRKDKLDRLNRQLGEFYGPLLAGVSAGNRSWEEFRKQYRPHGSYWDQDPPPTDDEARAWRLWITTVFMPLNRQLRDVVVTRADLLDEAEMPPCLLDLCAHVAAYEALLESWKAEHFASNKPPLPFPRRELSTYAEASFRRLKAEQGLLLT
jgi:hypothetical protein